MFVGLGLCLVLLLAASCSSDEPVAAPPSAAPRSGVEGLPTGTDLVAVEVTRPANPGSVAPQALPPAARLASAMAGLSDDQRICIDATIHGTVAHDPPIAADQGRLAGVIGGAISVCAGDRFTAALVDGLIAEFAIGDDGAACVRGALDADPPLRARLIGAAATASLTLIDEALTILEDTCGFALAD